MIWRVMSSSCKLGLEITKINKNNNEKRKLHKKLTVDDYNGRDAWQMRNRFGGKTCILIYIFFYFSPNTT